jgi:hypothetical protein
VIAAQWQNYQDSRPNLNFKQSLEHTRKRKPAEATHESMKFHSKPKFLIPVGSHRRSFFAEMLGFRREAMKSRTPNGGKSAGMDNIHHPLRILLFNSKEKEGGSSRHELLSAELEMRTPLRVQIAGGGPMRGRGGRAMTYRHAHSLREIYAGWWGVH